MSVELQESVRGDVLWEEMAHPVLMLPRISRQVKPFGMRVRWGHCTGDCQVGQWAGRRPDRRVGRVGKIVLRAFDERRDDA